jgi:lysophospholipase L1-like esterase
MPQPLLASFGDIEGNTVLLDPSSRPSTLHSCAAPQEKIYRNYTYEFGEYTATVPEAALARAQKNFGSARLDGFLCKLFSGRPVKVVVFGGSVTTGNGLKYQAEDRYSGQFESWLQHTFPTKPGLGPHRVLNKAVSATDMCYLARTVRSRLGDVDVLGDPSASAHEGSVPTDLVIIEYGINDIQVQMGHTIDEVTLTDLLFTDSLACTEAVVQILLASNRQLGVLFLEWHSWKLRDSITAQGVHQMVADRYNLPLLSFQRALFPELRSGAVMECMPVAGTNWATESLPFPYERSTRAQQFGPACCVPGEVMGLEGHYLSKANIKKVQSRYSM